MTLRIGQYSPNRSDLATSVVNASALILLAMVRSAITAVRGQDRRFRPS
jgi:hypothetical protein